MNSSVWKRVCVILTVFAVFPLTTGCWDRKEIEQRAAILAMAVDEVDKDNQTGSGSSSDSSSSGAILTFPEKESTASGSIIRLTAQIAVPGRIPLGPGQEGSQSGGGTQQSVWVVKAYGRTLQEAVQQLQQVVADPLFLGHLRVVVLSESFARDYGLRPIVDYLRRNPEARRTMWMPVAQGEAQRVLTAAPPLERVPALYLNATLQEAVKMGKTPMSILSIVLSQQYMLGRELVLPYLTAVGDDIRLDGVAAFDHGRMKFTLTPQELAIYLQLTGATTAGYTARVPVGKDQFVSWTAYHRKRILQVRMQGGRPEVYEFIHVDGNVVERYATNVDLSEPQTVRALDQTLEKITSDREEQLIHKLQHEGCDIVGYGEMIRAKQPRYWKQHFHSKDEWEKAFPSVPVHVKVTIRTYRTGMRAF